MVAMRGWLKTQASIQVGEKIGMEMDVIVM